MAEARIPVDLFNPGQVFACLGFLEAAEVLLGEAEAGFDWSDPAATRFVLRAAGARNPVAEVLEFLARAEVRRVAPSNHDDRTPKQKKEAKEEAKKKNMSSQPMPAPPPLPPDIEVVETFPDRVSDRMSLPVMLRADSSAVILSHWADGSGRDAFKLYAGNRSAHDIAVAMVQGTRAKPRKGQNRGDLETKGMERLWEESGQALIEDPFGITTPMGGSFNFDPRGAWTAIDAGYSPNTQKHAVEASPVVELLAAWGLEHARPPEVAPRLYGYAAWGTMLAPILARPALARCLGILPMRRFRFPLDLSGKNKVVTFATEDRNP